jgi:signal transduction histidine kinase
MENITSNLLLISGVAAVIIITILSLVVVNRIEQVQHLQNALKKMERSFNNLDEKAKLIAKTSLELNTAQEELDKRLNGLNALQKASRLISTTLDENEIFHRLDMSLMTDLGFEKNLVLVYGEEKILHARVKSGFTPGDINTILTHIEKNNSLKEALEGGHTFSSVDSPKQRRESITKLFDAGHFVLTPILTQNGITGMLFVGNRSNAQAVTEGDEELISILANQIGQSLENARLFEQVYRSSQILESKVQDRTHQLASALEEVKHISKTKSEFISAVSHELRTPLTSIKGYASILMAGKLGDIPESAKERLEKINIHSDNLVKFINNLLDISRIESGRVEMKMEECDICALVEGVHDLLVPQMKAKNIRWEAGIGADVPPVLLDRHQAERIFINLISNAIKFTPEEGTISVKAKREADAVTIDVSDTGIGIEKQDIGKLFDEFYRVDNEINQNVKGTGLGLSLVKKIVEAHQGKIWITSEVGQGTTFHFTLPITLKRKTGTEAG